MKAVLAQHPQQGIVTLRGRSLDRIGHLLPPCEEVMLKEEVHLARVRQLEGPVAFLIPPIVQNA
jgi:hypothetical protein